MSKHWIILTFFALISVACGSEQNNEVTSGQQDGFSLLTQSSENLELSFEIHSLFRTITLSGIKEACEDRLFEYQQAENPGNYSYESYQYAGADRKCARRNIAKQCEVYRYIHRVDCKFRS